MWSCTGKDEEKSKFTGLAQENGFGLAYLQNFAVAGKSRSADVHLQKIVYDLTAAQCF
jgi:hypothetical protein